MEQLIVITSLDFQTKKRQFREMLSKCFAKLTHSQEFSTLHSLLICMHQMMHIFLF